MLSGIRGRLAVMLVILGIAAAGWIANGINLGLDLQGGMHLALEVDDPDGTLTPEAREDATDQNLQILRNRLNQFGVAEPLVQKVGSDRIIVELPGLRDPERAKAIIERQAFLEWKLVRHTNEFRGVLSRLDRAVAAALGPEELGADTVSADTATTTPGQDIRELVFGRQDSAAVDSAAAQDPTTSSPVSRASPLTSLILDSGSDGEFLVPEQDVERVKRYLALPGALDALPRRSELRWGNEPIGQGAQLYRQLFFLDSQSFITGERLRAATAGRDPQFNKTIVTFELDRRGGRVFEQITSENIGNRIAIVLDTLVHSAPEVISRIGANGQIDMGQAPMEEASDLALVLRAGALAKPLAIVEQRSVGPTLGQDSIDQGMLAGIIGIVGVVVVMMLYYRVAGVMAVAALACYVLLVLGGLATVGADLTAPGIAGFILSLGMAVDANVLIFERIREELINGRSTRAAVDEGFKHAMSAIVDSNLTTLITGLILYQVGTGPVRGFAVTLSIGIVASFFTAVYITRNFFLVYLNSRRPTEPISI
ncbi:MAG: protein translocase subunit SecD [Gemmatimonadetes bacterium]|nr:protein translocase subunit SecD [Gemmatimonadota bacterium]